MTRIQTDARWTALDLLKCIFIGHFLRSGRKYDYSASLKINTLVGSFTSLCCKLPRISRQKEIEGHDIRRQKRKERESFPEWKHVGLYLMIYLSVKRQLYMWHWLRERVCFNLCETVVPLCVHVRCINHSLHILDVFRSTAEKSDLNSSLARMVYVVNMQERFFRYTDKNQSLLAIQHSNWFVYSVTSTLTSGTNNWHESLKTLMDILHGHFQT